MLVLFIVTVCCIVLVLIMRKIVEKGTECGCKTSADERAMHEKDREIWKCVIPYTSEDESKWNWVLYPSIIVYPRLDIPEMLTKGKIEEKKKKCRSKKSATKRAIDKKDKKISQCVTPHTERNASDPNWELCKAITSSANEPEALNKEKIEEKRKECHSNKSANKQAMDEKDKKISQRVIPHTERNASGRNWELFKTITAAVYESEALNKEYGKKKTNPQHQKPKKKRHTLILSPDSVPYFKEEEVLDESKKKLTKQMAMDCEMVGIGDGTESMIARVSLVNVHGFCVYDKYVKPREPVQDYRTKVSGIRPHNLQNGEDFQVVQKEVAEILRGRILVGHALKHDLDVLYLSHPRRHLRDTSRFKTFRQLFRGNTPSLKKLACQLLDRQIQTGEHSSVEDARAAMQLYVLYKNKWESEFYSKR